MHAEPRTRARPPAGTSLVELIAGMALSSLVVGLAVGACIAQMRLARTAAERAASNDAIRTVTAVLDGEARRMTRDDVLASGRDSIALRAFRGAGIPCGTTPAGVLVRYTGDRLPDATKDSVLAITPAASGTLPLLDTRPAPAACASLAGETVLEWRFDAAPPMAAVLAIFESGSYHLTTRALRYRVGAAGRQPLTAEALQHPGTAFTSVTDRAVRFDVRAGPLVIEHAAAFTTAMGRP